MYYTVLYRTTPYYTVLSYTIMYYTVLYCTILCYTVLYHTVLYFNVLYRIHFTLLMTIESRHLKLTHELKIAIHIQHIFLPALEIESEQN